jgi:chromosomal replication initiation ATPase DnaA
MNTETIPNRLDIQLITEIVCNEFRLSLHDLKRSHTLPGAKETNLCRARQYAMYFAKKYTRLSLASIGTFFNRNHCTVMHAVRIITNEIELYRESKLTHDLIKAELDSYNCELQVKLDFQQFDYPEEISVEALSYQKC